MIYIERERVGSGAEEATKRRPHSAAHGSAVRKALPWNVPQSTPKKDIVSAKEVPFL